MNQLGERYFVIIENYDYIYSRYDNPGIPLQVKYPVDIKWKEIAPSQGSVSDENFLSEELRGFGVKEFFIFGESGLWGRYAANDYVDDKVNPAGTPLNIIGFKNECAALFQEKFHTYMTKYERKMTRKFLSSPSLHPAYKEYTEHLY